MGRLTKSFATLAVCAITACNGGFGEKTAAGSTVVGATHVRRLSTMINDDDPSIIYSAKCCSAANPWNREMVDGDYLGDETNSNQTRTPDPQVTGASAVINFNGTDIIVAPAAVVHRQAAAPSKPPALEASALAAPRRPRLDWATLQHRTWGVDVWTCRCGGKRKVLSVVTSRRTAQTAPDKDLLCNTAVLGWPFAYKVPIAIDQASSNPQDNLAV